MKIIVLCVYLQICFCFSANVLQQPITSTLLPNRTVCGSVALEQILGGENASIGELPWMVLLEYKTKYGKYFNCGGSLINNRYVLTAAHCITEFLINVRLGEYDMSKTKDCEYCDYPIDLEIAEKIAHENYDNNANTNDIGLLRLAREVNYTDFIKPVCLPTTPLISGKSYNGARMTIAGWGLTENGTTSDILRKLNVVVTDVSDCEMLYRSKTKILDSLFCAGGKKSQDSCSGDSGGPLMIAEDVNIYAVGIISFGSRQCGLENWPTVHTKISYYMEWIVNNLKP